ncbi:MAG: TrbG/VirB9 family P-type conjugative transfer protein [Rickettsiales bacterium]|jgi:type IV secretion system protein VirB9|nr:TrbG/VirB9 family P-type conjugative transfer protein [Rickettsiales bacterium]
MQNKGTVYRGMNEHSRATRFFVIMCLLWVFTKILKPREVAAMGTDMPTTIDSRIKTIVYNPNEVIELTFHYGFQSFIELEEGEEIEIISLGESFPWKITPVGKRIFIRPMQINTSTNMTIITSKRTYMFQLKADSYENKGDEELIYSVRFFYPDNNFKIPKMPNASYSTLKDVAPKDGDSMGRVLNNFKTGTVLNFDYLMTTTNNKTIGLLKAFDDGLSTYFEFENNNVIPNIYAVDIYGKETQLEYIIDGPYVVVNTVQLQFSLRISDNIVCVFNGTMLD